MGDVGRGMLEKEIELNGINSEKKENSEGRPRTQSGPSRDEKENPKSKEDEEENPSLRKRGKVKMAKIDTKSIDDEDRNERKPKGSAHVRLRRINLEKLTFSTAL